MEMTADIESLCLPRYVSGIILNNQIYSLLYPWHGHSMAGSGMCTEYAAVAFSTFCNKISIRNDFICEKFLYNSHIHKQEGAALCELLFTEDIS